MPDKRATLLSAPYQDRTGQWRAGARIAGMPTGVNLTEEHRHLRTGDTINVVETNTGWRAR